MMIKPLSIVGIVVIALSFILQSPTFAQIANQSEMEHIEYPAQKVISNSSSGLEGPNQMWFIGQFVAFSTWLINYLDSIGRYIGIVAGLITIAYIFPSAFRFIFAIYSMFRKGVIEGIWHSYHYTRKNGQLILRYEEWKIYRDLQNRICIKTNDPEDPLLKYKGYIYGVENHLLFTLKGIFHEEEVHMRFQKIIPTGQDMSIGIAMGVDFHGRPQCLLRIMSRRRLSDDEARKILDHKTMMKNGILSIREDDIDTSNLDWNQGIACRKPRSEDDPNYQVS